MKLKSIDFKELLLQKGEWIGLWTCVSIMGVMLVLGGYAAFTSASPTQAADEIGSKTRQITEHVRTAPPSEKREIDPIYKSNVRIDPVDGSKYQVFVDVITANALDDTKARNPDILGPTEFHVELLRTQTLRYIFSDRRDKVAVLKGKEVVKTDAKELKKLADRFRDSRNRFSNPGMQNAMQTYNPQNRETAQATTPTAPAKAPERELELVATEEKALQGRELATDIHPVRMAIVTASFPFREQVDKFRRALKVRTVNELLSDPRNTPRFLGFEVERRARLLNGQPKPGEDQWTALDLKRDYVPILVDAVAMDLDDPELKPVLFSGMVMPRPKLAKDRYPDHGLQLVHKTIADLKAKAGNTNAPVIPPHLRRALGVGNLGLFDPLGTEGGNETGPGTAERPPMMERPVLNPNVGQPNPEVADSVPENFHCLMRFIDVTVQPGCSYDYRVRVKMANPNYGQKERVAYPSLAEKPELDPSPWVEVGQPVVVPPELYYYTVDANVPPTSEMARFQFHQWLLDVRLSLNDNQSRVPVGDWVVADTPIPRGEYIARLVDTVEVPVWVPTKEAYDIASTNMGAGKVRPRFPTAKWPAVHFTTRPGASAEPPALLIDFEGGKGMYKLEDPKIPRTISDECQVETLILTPDGKLIVRNTQRDAKDAEREARQKAYKEWVSEVKKQPRKINDRPTEGTLFDKPRPGGARPPAPQPGSGR